MSNRHRGRTSVPTILCPWTRPAPLSQASIEAASIAQEILVDQVQLKEQSSVAHSGVDEGV